MIGLNYRKANNKGLTKNKNKNKSRVRIKMTHTPILVVR
jgi:hypothetical protein